MAYESGNEAAAKPATAVVTGASGVAPGASGVVSGASAVATGASFAVGSTVTAAGRTGMGVVTRLHPDGRLFVQWPAERLGEYRDAADLAESRR